MVRDRCTSRHMGRPAAANTVVILVAALIGRPRSFADGKVDHDLLLQVISAAMRFVVVRMLRHGLDAVTRKRRARRKADSKAQ